MANHIIHIPEELKYREGPQKAVFEYHAKNGQVFTLEAWYYEASETLSELSRQAYENETEMDFIVIY